MTGSNVILVPLDGSAVAEGVLPYAEALAQALGSALRLLFVAPAGPGARDRLPDQPTPVEAEQTLAATAADLRSRGVRVSTVTERGAPAGRIVAAADEARVDLVLMATHGRGGLERAIIGSVADEVMRRSRRPTLLVVPSDFSPEQAAPQLRRFMVPLDGSPLAEAALPLAIRLAMATEAQLTFVQALAPVAATPAPGTYISDLGKWEQERTAEAQSYLESICTNLTAAVRCESLVLRGLSPADSLLRFAQSGGVDLVIMSTHGYGGLKRFAIGSNADLLVRSAVPTLLVRPPAPENRRGFAVRFELHKPVATAVECVKHALIDEGFSLLAETEFERSTANDKTTGTCTVITAWHAGLGERAVSLDRESAVLLPVTLLICEEGEGSVAESGDPVALRGMARTHALDEVAHALRERLESAFQKAAFSETPLAAALAPRAVVALTVPADGRIRTAHTAEMEH